MTPEERDAKSRQHPMWPVFEAYYAGRVSDSQALTAGATVSGMTASPPPPGGSAPPTRKFWTKPAGIAAVVVVVVGLLLIGFRLLGAVADPGNREAVDHCQSEVRNKTQAPSRVVFADGADVSRDGDSYNVSGDLEMPNGYGGTIRGIYSCSLQQDGSRWVTTSALVQPR